MKHQKPMLYCILFDRQACQSSKHHPITVPCCCSCERYASCDERCQNSAYKCGMARRRSQMWE